MLLIFSTYEYSRLISGIPLITRASELTERVGDRIKIAAEIEYTGIYGRYSEGRGRQRTTRTWHLYIINFEDAPVAFRSIRDDVHTREYVYGAVMRMPADFISEGLLNKYLLDDTNFSQYTARLFNRNAADDLLCSGIVVILIGGFFGAIYLLSKRWRTV